MNDQFDELAKGMAQSVTRRAALKKFGVGLAGIALAALGLATKAEASKSCRSDADCDGMVCYNGHCVPFVPQCLGSGSRCKSHSECCSGWCRRHRCY